MGWLEPTSRHADVHHSPRTRNLKSVQSSHIALSSQSRHGVHGHQHGYCSWATPGYTSPAPALRVRAAVIAWVVEGPDVLMPSIIRAQSQPCTPAASSLPMLLWSVTSCRCVAVTAGRSLDGCPVAWLTFLIGPGTTGVQRIRMREWGMKNP